jgi:hypothetical protein
LLRSVRFVLLLLLLDTPSSLDLLDVPPVPVPMADDVAAPPPAAVFFAPGTEEEEEACDPLVRPPLLPPGVGTCSGADDAGINFGADAGFAVAVVVVVAVDAEVVVTAGGVGISFVGVSVSVALDCDAAAATLAAQELGFAFSVVGCW